MIFERPCGRFEFAPPAHPVIHNVSAEPASEPEEIRELIVKQLRSPVRWCDSVQKISDDGGGVFVEIGPNRVAGRADEKNPAQGRHPGASTTCST